ncbi:MAG: DUF1116 domain-containing protein [Caldilineaceae bacterium]
MAVNIDQANTVATNRMMDARPVLVGLGTARDVIPGMHENLLLHAGPPITGTHVRSVARRSSARSSLKGARPTRRRPKRWPPPARSSLRPATITTPSAPWRASRRRPWRSTSSRTRRTPTRAAATGPSAISTKATARCCATVRTRKTCRRGCAGCTRSWRRCWATPSSRPAGWTSALLAEALHMGDEGHNRNKAGSILYTAKLAPHIARVAPDGATAADIIAALGENALSVLNPVMAACKAMCDAGHGVEGSTIVTAMARNGTDFGIRVSGLGSQWFTAPAQVPDGLYFPGFGFADANADIGDSTITETAGIGGFAMAAAPAIVTFVSGAPKDAVNATMEMYEINFTEHKSFTIPALDFRGTPTGIDLRKVVETGITPRINTGIAHKEAGVGQVGAGLVRPPMAIFEEALVAFAEQYGF